MDELKLGLIDIDFYIRFIFKCGTFISASYCTDQNNMQLYQQMRDSKKTTYDLESIANQLSSNEIGQMTHRTT